MKPKKEIKKAPQPLKVKASLKNKTLFEKWENVFKTKKYFILAGIGVVSLIFTFFLFNVKISEANDDALYSEAAYNFSKNFFGFYTAYAPLYPMVLSILVKIFGINVVILKLTSVVFMLLSFYFLFKAFENRIPYFILFFIILLTGINSYFLYYSSMTFTEQFFLMLQAIFLYVFFKAYDKIDSTNGVIQQIKLWLPVALVLFVLSMTRNLAIGILIPLFVFLILQKKYLHVLYFAGAFLLFRVPFEFFRKMMWGEKNQFANQVSVLIKQKDPYDVSKGFEDFSGFIQRFQGNYGLYICKRFYQILGFLSENDKMVRSGLGFIFFAFFVFAMIYILRKKNKYLVFSLFYTGAMVCFTFIAIQTRWDQYRLILVFVPLILILIFTSFYELVKNKGSGLQFLVIAAAFVLLSSSLVTSIKKSMKNYPVLKKNISGDLFYGYTEDWANYLRMSKWCGDSLPPPNFVACRKAPMSFIYANGKEFYPVYQVFSTDPDTVLNTFKQNKVTHVIVASLRRNPKVIDGYVINTLQRLLQPLAQKYPDKLVLVKKIGESEPAYLYKINY
ncbi:MAG TPA: hypothetical protein VJY62_17060 [Bacteroidia bacterium]|nr:hypothetical protein [Bacteroidia bacterium]